MKHSLYFLLIALAVAIVLVYLIVEPFLSPLILAAIFAFLFQPLYRRLKRVFGGGGGLASGITTALAIVIILLPLALLGIQILKESGQMYESVVVSGRDNFILAFGNITDQIKAIIPIPVDLKLNLSQYLERGLGALIQNLGAIFSSLAKLLLNAFVFLIAFFFFLKDGHRLKNYFVALSPLADQDDELIASRLKLAIISVVKGNLAIGLIQGALTGVGFTLFGIPHAVLWGSVAAIAALIPGIGTALVLLPAIIFLFSIGETARGVGLLIWGFTAVGLIDNILGPKLVGQGMRLHPLAVFISVLGGLTFFGPLGFLLGPLTVSFCLALIDIYFSLKKSDPEMLGKLADQG